MKEYGMERAFAVAVFLTAPAAASFIVQSILCYKIKNRILRHGTLIFPMIFIVFGAVTLLTQYGDIFSGLGVIASMLWFAGACCAVFGYVAAWIMALAVKNRRNSGSGKNRGKSEIYSQKESGWKRK